VSVTAFSIGLVSSVPLTRAGLGSDGAARHVVSSTWVALALIGPAVGVLALAGGGIVEAVLGDAYGGDIGTQVARLVVLLSAWTVASVGVNVAFPLVFVAERLRALPWIGAVALALQVLLAWMASELFELDGLALALTLTTGLVLAALLQQLGALGPGARGVVRAALVVAAFTAAAFVPPALLLGSAGAALVGVAVYAVLVAIARPAELTRSWAYLRALR
jgi:hypothetical protein